MTTRFFCPIPLLPGQTITLPQEAAHHALRVLRLGLGDELVLFNGEGGEWRGHLVESGRNVRVALDGWQEVEREPGLHLTLAQALPAARTASRISNGWAITSVWPALSLAASRISDSSISS